MHVRLWDLLNCSLPVSSVHGIFQARILEQVAISHSRGSFWPRDWTCISSTSCIGRRVPYHYWHLQALKQALLKPGVPLLGTCPGKTTIQKDKWTPAFITALFTTANTRRQRKCASTEKWIKKMWCVCIYIYICTMEYNSAIKRNKLCHLQRRGWT